jgi:hypothetical protein
MVSKHHIVYCTTHLPTGRYYIGIHSTVDLHDGYRGSGKLIRRLLRAHPAVEFHFKIIANFLTRKEASDLEAMLVQPFVVDKALFPNVLNLRTGGDNDYVLTPSEDQKHRTGESLRATLANDPELCARRKHNQTLAQNQPEVKAKRVKTLANTRANTDLDARLSEASKDAWADPVKRNRILASRNTPEATQRRRDAAKRPCTEASKQKLAAFWAAKREAKANAKLQP